MSRSCSVFTCHLSSKRSFPVNPRSCGIILCSVTVPELGFLSVGPGIFAEAKSSLWMSKESPFVPGAVNSRREIGARDCIVGHGIDLVTGCFVRAAQNG